MDKFVTQNGRIFARKGAITFETGNARINIPSIAANLTCTLANTAPFDGVIDETGAYWQLDDRHVVYGQSSVTLNLYDILDKRGLIKTPSSITIGTGANSKTLSRYPESDSHRGFAWRVDNYVVFTTTPVAATGIDWYGDPLLTDKANAGTTGFTNPVLATGYSYTANSWQAAFSVVPQTISFTVVETGTYTEPNNQSR